MEQKVSNVPVAAETSATTTAVAEYLFVVVGHHHRRRVALLRKLAQLVHARHVRLRTLQDRLRFAGWIALMPACNAIKLDLCLRSFVLDRKVTVETPVMECASFQHSKLASFYRPAAAGRSGRLHITRSSTLASASRSWTATRDDGHRRHPCFPSSTHTHTHPRSLPHHHRRYSHVRTGRASTIMT